MSNKTEVLTKEEARLLLARKGGFKAKASPVVNAPAPDKGKTPAEPAQRRTAEKRADDQRDAPLRPACDVTTWDGLPGFRFVAHSVSRQQAQGLLDAARQLGIRIATSLD